MDLTAGEVRTDVIYQLGALMGFASYHGVRVAHLAPHGRLGNLVATRDDYAEAVVDAVRHVDPGLRILAQDGCLATAARSAGIAVGIVGIADRSYQDDGKLVPRSQPGAVIHDPAEIAARTVRMVSEGVIYSTGGVAIPIRVPMVLLHGDTPASVDLARRIRSAPEAVGVTIAAPQGTQ